MNKRDSQLPLARTEKLIVKEIDDEVLVYDLVSDKAHCLNHTAALVWKNCDGKKSVSQIAALLTDEVGKPVDDRIVWLGLEDLEKFDLLETAPIKTVAFGGMNRRQMIRAASVAAIALPVVVSIIAPTPAMAASPCGTGDPCTTPADCCSAHPTCVTTGAPAGRGCRP
jgi:hypothetical protein